MLIFLIHFGPFSLFSSYFIIFSLCFIPQKEVIAPKQGPRVATTTSELPDYGQQLIANTPDIIPKSQTGKPLPATAYVRPEI